MTDRNQTPTLLVLRHHGLGDLMTAQPVLRGLRRKFPGHRLVVTCPSWLLPLAQFLDTADSFVSDETHAPSDVPSDHNQIDDVLLANVTKKVPHCDVLVALRTPGPELVDVVMATNPRLLVSYRCSDLPATLRNPELDFSDHILVRWRRILAPIGVELRDDDLYVRRAPPGQRDGMTVVHVGAGSPARLWPVDRWAEVVRHLHGRGHRIALTGSKREEARVSEVQRQAGLTSEYNFCGSDIMKLAGLVAAARLVTSVDTGVSHLATAFRRPAVTLFGPVPPAWWGPPPGNPQHRVLWAGELGEPYGDTPDRGLMEITVPDVVGAVETLVAREGESVWHR